MVISSTVCQQWAGGPVSATLGGESSPRSKRVEPGETATQEGSGYKQCSKEVNPELLGLKAEDRTGGGEEKRTNNVVSGSYRNYVNCVSFNVCDLPIKPS